jgi:poly(A) polymerase
MAGPSVLLDALMADAAGDALRDLDRSGVLTRLIPELEAGRGFVQPELHHYDVLDHSFAAVEAFDTLMGATARGRRLRKTTYWFDLDASLAAEIEHLPIVALVRLSCLVHDIAKPATATYSEGRLRFPRHGPEGAETLQRRLPALGFGPESTDLVARLVRYHLRPAELVRNHPVSDRAVRRFSADVRGQVLGLMLLNLCDGWATRGPNYTEEHFERHCGFLNYVVARAWLVEQPEMEGLVDGEDLLREMGLESGRLLGAVLTSIRRAQVEGHITTRDEALALARELLVEHTGHETQPSAKEQ